VTFEVFAAVILYAWAAGIVCVCVFEMIFFTFVISLPCSG